MKKLAQIFLGKSKNPMSPETRRNIALIAFFAWVGLGSDGLSSANYGPEEAFKALGTHMYLGLYLAIATAFTVFVISFSYNQVIELFPNGGGGYKVANKLIHPLAGLVSGSALIIDYILTIAISVAAATDALFSLLPPHDQAYRLVVEIFAVCFLSWLNLRGMKESIKVLLPIFLGFVIIHFGFIVYGIIDHFYLFPKVVHDTSAQTHNLIKTVGTVGMLAIFLKAYSLGGGTYTGLEAVSNNVNCLAEPRVKTGKWTMFYMAVSLSLIAGGIIMLYLLYGVSNVPGQTYNAIVFNEIMGKWHLAHPALIITLIFEAGILFIGANTGFFGGPAVLANMAMDGWVPNRFRNLSSRLVKQNGIIVFGLGAILILLLTDGQVGFLVVLYSTNVFLTFAITLFGLSKYWATRRKRAGHWKRRLLLSLVGFIICAGILVVIVVEKFHDGGWLTLVVTSIVVVLCYYTKRYYNRLAGQLNEIDELLAQPLPEEKPVQLEMLPNEQTAVFFVGNHIGEGMHTLLWTQRLFPNLYKNYVFVRVGVVDVENFDGDDSLERMQEEVKDILDYFVDYSHHQGIPAKAYSAFGTDPVEQLTELADKINTDFPNCVFFAGNIISTKDSWLMRILHNETALAVQRKLHLSEKKMVILPMRL